MKKEMILVKPDQIESRSMEMIETEMRAGSWTPEELAVVKRCIHTSADFDYADNLYFSDDAVQTAIQMFRRGVTIITDTNMAAAGINKQALSRSGSRVRCFMADEDVAREAKERGVTRAMVSMERAAARNEAVCFAIGNAPTALIRLHEMILEKCLTPVFIIAAPVGFVNVVESKELIATAGIPCIVARGRKGGSNIAAAICNALLYQAVGRESVSDACNTEHRP